MNAYRKLVPCALVAAALAVLIPNAQAQEIEERMRVTFSGPVEIPGVVLPAGTYIFEELQNERATRILSADEQHIYATLLTVPVERTEPMEKSTIILSERQPNLPQKVEEWFYPGDSIGSEFIYPKAHSRKDAASIMTAPGKEVSRGAVKASREVGVSCEFLAVHIDHLVANSMGHALKVLV